MAQDLNTKPIEDAFERMARSIRNQEQSSYKLSEAFDKLGEAGVKDLTEKIKAAAKQSGFFTAAQLKLIKTTQDLEDAIKHQEKDLGKRSDAEKELRASIRETIKLIKSETQFSQAEVDASKASLKLKFEALAKMKQEDAAKKASIDAFKDHTAALIENATSIVSWQYYLNKSKDSINGFVASQFTAKKSLEMLKTAGIQLIDEFNKVTAVGLQGSFVAISYEAVKLKLTFDEFSGIIAKNYDVINQLGGGQLGIEKFSSQLKDASTNLSFMGRDGTLATARFYETLKTFGDTAGSKHFTTAMKTTQDEFVKFQGRYHDTAESFADLMESQTDAASMQRRLNGLDNIARDQLTSEIYLRAENLKNMGLSNEQIKEFNGKLESLYNPQKADETKVIKEAEMTMTYVTQLAQQSGSQTLQASMPFLRELMDYKRKGGNIADKMKTPEGQALLKGINEGNSLLEKQRKDIVDMGGDAITQQTTLARLNALGGDTTTALLSLSTLIGKAEREGKPLTAEQNAKADAESKAAQAKAVDKTTEAMEALRDASQWASAIMKNSLVAGVLAAGTALIAFGLGVWKVSKALTLLAAASERAAIASGIPVPGGGPAASGSGKGRKYGRAALGAAAGGGLLYAGSELGGQGGPEKTPWANTGSKALDWAGTGALLGALVPGLGELGISEAVGGAIGGVAGAGVGMYQNWNDFGSNTSKINQTSAGPEATAEHAVAVAAETEAGQSQSTTPAEKSNNIIEELKKHTDILLQISRNTIAFKGGNPDMYKSTAARVATNAFSG